MQSSASQRVGPTPAVLVEAAAGLNLTRLELAVLRQLYRLQMRYGRLPCIRYAVLAAEVDAHHGSVRRAVRDLEALGLVQRLYDAKRPGSRPGGRAGQIGQRPNRFVVRYGEVMRCARARMSLRRARRKAGAHPCAPDPLGSRNPSVPVVSSEEIAEPPPPGLLAAPPVAGPGVIRALLRRRRTTGD
ncbi:MAG: hypothetical protein ACJ72W_06640 [Actinoallomurus sp.]